MSPITNPIEINITKNSGTTLLISAEEIAANFETGLIDICPVTSYEFLFPKVTSVLPKAFLQGDDGSIYVSTSLPSDSLMEFKLTATEVTGLTDYLKSGAFEVLATVGCFYETVITPNFEPYSTDYDFVLTLP